MASLRGGYLHRMPAAGNPRRSALDFQNCSPLPFNYMNGAQNSTYSNHPTPPPLPPRSDMTQYNRFSNYNCYSPFSRFAPGMYSSGMYGGYRAPFGHYDAGFDPYSSFIQLAEESSRPAFESIESVVNIVSSISMMLESTYQAIYGSYSAVLGVVDHFSRLKDHLAQVLSFLAVLRGLKYICLKILYFLRLRKENPSVEAAWNTAQGVADSSNAVGISDNRSPMPFLIFCGLVFGTPWLMFKLLSKSVSQKPVDINKYKKGPPVVGMFDFKSTRNGDLPFQAGEKLLILSSDSSVRVPKGWVLACNKDKRVGLIPANYIKKAVRQKDPAPPMKTPHLTVEASVPSTSGYNPNMGADLDLSFFLENTENNSETNEKTSDSS